MNDDAILSRMKIPLSWKHIFIANITSDLRNYNMKEYKELVQPLLETDSAIIRKHSTTETIKQIEEI